MAGGIKTLDTEANTADGTNTSADLSTARRDLATTLAAEKKVLGEASNSSLQPGQCGAGVGEAGADADEARPVRLS